MRGNLDKYLGVVNLGCTSSSPGGCLKFYRSTNHIAISGGKPYKSVFFKPPPGDTEAQQRWRVNDSRIVREIYQQ